MFTFTREQQVIDIDGVKIGGQPGEYPTVIIPTIFYDGHNIVDVESNDFDKKKAEDLINLVESQSDITKNPCMFQVVGITPEIMPKALDFVADHTDSPLIIDSADLNARLVGLDHVTEAGYGHRVMYNAINMLIEEDEIDALTRSEIDGVVILDFNLQDTSVEARMALLEDGGEFMDRGMLDIAKSCGFEKILFDPGVQPIEQGAGASFRLMYSVKAKYGLPTGIGAHNIPSSWAWLKSQESTVRKSCDMSSNAAGIILGADSLFIGPIENAPYAFPTAAMIDMLCADSALDFGIKHIEEHPYSLA